MIASRRCGARTEDTTTLVGLWQCSQLTTARALCHPSRKFRVYCFVRVLAAEMHAQLVTEVVTEVQAEVVAQLVVAIYGPLADGVQADVRGVGGQGQGRRRVREASSLSQNKG